MADKNKAVWEWIQQYQSFDKLFYNFCMAEDGNKNFIPNPTNYVMKQYIDGSTLRYYDFAITSFSRYSDVPYDEENILDYKEMQKFIEWIDEQNKLRNYPNFGSNCNIIEVSNLQNNPSSSLEDKELAKYMIQCRITYEEE